MAAAEAEDGTRQARALLAAAKADAGDWQARHAAAAQQLATRERDLAELDAQTKVGRRGADDCTNRRCGQRAHAGLDVTQLTSTADKHGVRCPS